MTQKKQDYNLDNDDKFMENEENALEKEKNDGGQKQKTQEDSTRPCLESLLKIIDVGLDKNYEDFMQDIYMISQPLIKITESFNVMANTGVKDTPITSYRKFLKPKYTEKRKISVPIYENDNLIIQDHGSHPAYFNLYEINKLYLEQVYKKYFIHLEDQESDKEEKKLDNKRKRMNFYRDCKIKLILVEDQKVLSSFIDQLFNIYKKIDDNYFYSENDYLDLFSKFVDEKNEIEMNFILYIVPQIDNIREIIHSPNIKGEKNVNEEILPLLSEFIASHDYIYKTMVFNSWGVPRDSDITDYINKINDLGKYEIDFKAP